MSNNNSKLIGGVLAVGIVVIGTLFTFSYQRSSEAYETAIQNRERIAVIESQYQEIRETLDEVRMDVKTILRNK
ncbi:unnamed protein product [marine sediment metagenome]|uniref:Uncharacterized protein n=1 Tax=marine sediment metagenome TaxID=412755 RepID=X1KMS9_9ZZZZ